MSESTSEQTPRRWPVMLGLVLLILALASLVGLWQAAEVEKQMRADLLTDAQRLADSLNPQRLAALSGTLTDLELPEYHRLKRQLQAARHAHRDWRFVYLMARLPDQQIVFWVDSEPPGLEDESLPGEVYDGEFTAEELRVFEPGYALTTAPSADAWGVWVSALIPIKAPVDYPGQLILGVDIDAGDWRRQVLIRAGLPLALTALMLLLISATGLVLFEQRARRRSTQAGALRWLEPALVVAVGLVLTAAAGWIIHSQGQRDQARLFQLLTDAAVQGIIDDLHDLRDFGLSGLASLFQASERVDSAEFRLFTDQLVRSGLSEHWAWAPRVPAAERAVFEREIQAKGLSDFRIWEMPPQDQELGPDRELLYPLTLATEGILSLAVGGLDMASLPHLRVAIEAAENSGLATALGPLDGAYLAPLRGQMLVFQPTGPRLDADAREGMVITSTGFDDLISAWAGVDSLVLGLWLLHEDGSREPLTELARNADSASASFELERPVLALGETFLIRAAPGPAFIAAQRNLSGARTLLGGAVLTLLLAVVVGMIVRQRETLELAVRERTAALQEFRAAVEQSNDGIALASVDGTVHFINRAWAEMHGCGRAEAIGRPIDIFHTPKQLEDEVNPGIRQLFQDGYMVSEVGHVDRHGKTFPTRMSASLVRNDRGEPYRILGIARDISTEQQQREREQFNQRFQTLVADIAAGFVSAADDQAFDARLDHALTGLGQLFGVDRAYVFQFSPDKLSARNSHEWCASGIEPQKAVLQSIPVADKTWWLDQWREKRPIQIEDVERLPLSAAAEQQLLQSQSIRSLVCLPMQDERAQLTGFIGFDSVRTQRRWPDEQVHMLQSVADILAGALRRRQILQDLAESEARFRDLAQESRSFRWQVDLNGLYTDVDPLVTDILGYQREDIIGRKHFYDLTPAADRENVRLEGLRQIRSGRRFTGYENRLQARDGRILWVTTTILPLFDDKGVLIGVRGSDTDITERKLAQLQIEHAAHHDLLTGLPNRVLLADRLQQAMAQAERRHDVLGVACLDLDEFKPINDRFGHEIGDRLLITIAKRMRDSLREGDTVARLGGDEFALVLVGLDRTESARILLERLLHAVSEPVEIEGNMLSVSVSVGVAFYPQADDIDADQLLRQADQAMYEAKLSGKNRFHWFDAEHDRRLRDNHQQLQRIQEALQNEEFILHYQPKVDMQRGRLIGVEALIRWQHPERGLLPPAAFLPLLEKHKLMLDLGDWVLDTVLKQITDWRGQGIDIPVSLNVDPLQLAQPNFLSQLADRLALHPQVRPGDLELEVLETSALDESVPMVEIIRQGAQLGVSFALDDFGTGYSSLSYLKRLPVSTLKIDRSFVLDMLRDPDDLAILQGVVGLARAFGQLLIAEGVETEEHGQMLLRLGCTLGQGYAIARPMPADALEPWMKSWSPPASWQQTRSIEAKNLPLLIAIVEHRAWAARLIEALESDSFAKQNQRTLAADFVNWIEQVRPDFAGLQDYLDLHAQLEQQAEAALRLAQAGKVDAARQALGAIEGMNQEAIDLLTRGVLHD